MPEECADDVKSIEWFKPSEIDLSQIAFKSIREILRTVISEGQPSDSKGIAEVS